jgi:hypothetical protein
VEGKQLKKDYRQIKKAILKLASLNIKHRKKRKNHNMKIYFKALKDSEVGIMGRVD